MSLEKIKYVEHNITEVMSSTIRIQDKETFEFKFKVIVDYETFNCLTDEEIKTFTNKDIFSEVQIWGKRSDLELLKTRINNMS